MSRVSTTNLDGAVSIIDNRTLDDVRDEAEARLRQQFEDWQNAGVTINGITLDASQYAQSQFVSGLTLLREAEELGMGQQTTTITDINGTPITDTVQHIRQLLVAFGFQILTKRNTMIGKIVQARALTDIAQIDGVNL